MFYLSVALFQVSLEPVFRDRFLVTPALLVSCFCSACIRNNSSFYVLRGHATPEPLNYREAAEGGES